MAAKVIAFPTEQAKRQRTAPTNSTSRRNMLANLAEQYLRIRSIEDRSERREQFVIWDAEVEELAARI
ncbi:hypothetical protein [Pontibacterium sp.]|uniref:hypothetical protein n=1 Tax=Pontibacterium sp. TaxID=2036026 RepID=UPI003516A5D0